MLLISPDYLRIDTTDTLPLKLKGYKITNSQILFGETPQAKYLFQDLYTKNFHACFIDVLTETSHRFFITKNNAGFFFQVQLQNTLHCKFEGLPETYFYEWGMNLFFANKLFVEVNANKTFSTFILFIPDKEINLYAKKYPTLQKFIDVSGKINHTVKILFSNAISNFLMIDLINDVREKKTLQPETFNEILKTALDTFSKNKTERQPFIEPAIADKLHGLKKYMTDNLTKDFKRKTLLTDFKISVYHFEKTFAKIYNATPYHVLKDYRMSAIKKELQEHTTDLKELANRFHYSYNAIGKAFYSVYKKKPVYNTKHSVNKRK